MARGKSFWLHGRLTGRHFRRVVQLFFLPELFLFYMFSGIGSWIAKAS